MANPEVHFTDPCFAQEFPPLLGGLARKLQLIANDVSRDTFKGTFIPDPTDIELTPTTTVDGVSFIMRMWHQTSGDNPAVLQRADTAFSVAIEGEDVLLQTEANVTYALTPREALVVGDMARHAMIHSLAHMQPGD